MRYSQRMLDIKSKLHLLAIGGVVALVGVVLFTIWRQHSTIDDLRVDLANERAAHAVTRASVTALETEIARQNGEIEAQRANSAQAKRDLAAAINATAGAQDVIERLAASARAVPAGPACAPSETVREIWK